ncbi:amino acid ABC transporter permease [Desulfomarina profundi]|uniref:Amino acid ABC transporter permease n=1 Tax=Desulfomarina profundi TaxID=2772557 RepID=A0A8D5JEA6_9BACT|nr:amino acid ABC transporter permease [Desulfomarina profundi]BCL62268.1 amino acid ABC transporter permease [Desulfomarina profundi]
MHYKLKRITPLDCVVLLALFLFAGFICYRLFYSLNYRWNWSVIPTYMFRLNENTGKWEPNILLEGLFTTLRLSFWGMVLAILIGFLFGLMRVSTRLFFRLAGRTYIELIRNTPPLVLVFIFYYFITDQILVSFAIDEKILSSPAWLQKFISIFFADPPSLNPFLSGVLTLALFQGAYIAEIVRAGIQSIKQEQWESAWSLGLNKWQVMRLIILPEAIRIMLPPLGNEFINTVKWSSIVSIISIQELTFQGLQVMASTHATIELWITISVIYLLLCLTLSVIVAKIERRLSRFDSFFQTGAAEGN